MGRLTEAFDFANTDRTAESARERYAYVTPGPDLREFRKRVRAERRRMEKEQPTLFDDRPDGGE